MLQLLSLLCKFWDLDSSKPFDLSRIIYDLDIICRVFCVVLIDLPRKSATSNEVDPDLYFRLYFKPSFSGSAS